VMPVSVRIGPRGVLEFKKPAGSGIVARDWR